MLSTASQYSLIQLALAFPLIFHTEFLPSFSFHFLCTSTCDSHVLKFFCDQKMCLTLSFITFSFESFALGNLNTFLFHVLIFSKFQAAEQLMNSCPLSAKGFFFLPVFLLLFCSKWKNLPPYPCLLAIPANKFVLKAVFLKSVLFLCCLTKDALLSFHNHLCTSLPLTVVFSTNFSNLYE